MGLVTIPNRPAGSDVRSIAQILADFDAITAVINGNIDAANILDASITSAKFAPGATSSVPVGVMFDYPIEDDPADPNYILADGRALSRTTYATLFNALVPDKGTVTITLASPGVITTGVAHKLRIGDPVYFTTTGNLPTGLTPNTIYYVLTVPTTTTLTVSETLGGAAVNTSVGQNGVHSMRKCPHGNGDGTTTFNIPDTRGRVTAGQDDMRTAAGAASRLPGQTTKVMGGTVGTDTYTLTTAQIPTLGSHGHRVYGNANAGGSAVFNNPTGSGYTDGGNDIGSAAGTTTGGTGGSHPNMQPTLLVNKIIKVA